MAQPRTTANKRKAWLVLAGLLLSLAILAAPSLWFWFSWLRLTEPVPDIGTAPVSAMADEALSGEREASFEAMLQEARIATAAPSISVAVAMDGRMTWAGAVGYADIENRKIAGPDSMYRLGSVSKPVTGIILARLLDRGEISLDDRVMSLVPALPEAYADVTIRQLASHTAGIRHYQEGFTLLPWQSEILTPRHYSSVWEGLDMFLGDPLLFEPGSDFSYSTFGYSLLAHAMEQASGQNFAELLETEIREPAGVDFRLDDITQEIPDRVTYYISDDGNYTLAWPADPSYKWAGGGILASPASLAVLGLRLQDEKFLSNEALTTMWTTVPLPGEDSNPQNYSLGWRQVSASSWRSEENPVIAYHHGGVQIGGVSFWVVVPEFGISAAATANTEDGNVRGEIQDLTLDMVRLLIEEKMRNEGNGTE